MSFFLEAAVPIVIITVCVPLFLLWLNAMHSLVVSDATAIEYSLRVAATMRMHYPDAMRRIEAGEEGAEIYGDLLKDLQLLETLQGKSLWVGASIETKVALAGFTAATALYRMMRLTGVTRPRREALAVMGSSIRYLSGAAGAQADRGV